MKKYILLIIILFFVASTTDSYSQCSDAGICFIGGKSNQAKSQFGISYTYGKSDEASGLSFNSLKLIGDVIIYDDVRLAFDLPYSTQSGNLGNVKGLGDISFLIKYFLINENDSKFAVQGGVKLATANINSGNLPQAYQSGLGTNDILLGLSYAVEKFNFSAAYQISRGRNKNSIDRLKRGDDLMLRGGYADTFGDFRFSGELIALKRLHKSSIVDPLNLSHFVDVPGSDQFQIDLMAKVGYLIISDFNIETVFAIPFLKRKINIDGLTRAFTISISSFYSFSI
ncbi:MAG: hypothetical protein KJ666_17395 [Bacteroidetes bacterium]|nr:hypothetical protein [Bacteroidota bacterium]MBU2585842.1 hypothetical protein [Bacteroidota bacterium]